MQIDVNGTVYKGPIVEAKADADPREFIIDVDGGPVNITLKYIACDDKETWCKRLTQEFAVTQEADPDAGRISGQRPGGGRARGGFGRRPGGGRPGGGSRRPGGE